MKKLIASQVIAVAFVGIASADPYKCMQNGEILYTDDVSLCNKAKPKPVNGNISVFPGVSSSKKHALRLPPAAQPAAPTEVSGDSLLEQFGLSPQDIENGWKTIMDARHRGTWQAPELPQEAE